MVDSLEKLRILQNVLSSSIFCGWIVKCRFLSPSALNTFGIGFASNKVMWKGASRLVGRVSVERSGGSGQIQGLGFDDQRNTKPEQHCKLHENEYSNHHCRNR